MYSGKSPITSVVWLLVITAAMSLLPHFVAQSAAQEIPRSVQQQLQRQGMTANEARREAVRLGIDLTDPEAAVQRAREIGIPESLIQEMISAIEEEELGEAPLAADRVDREVPALAGRPIITPDVIFLPEHDPLLLPTIEIFEDELEEIVEGDSVYVRIPLKDELSGIEEADLFFLSETGEDTLYSYQVRRVLGSKYEGFLAGAFHRIA